MSGVDPECHPQPSNYAGQHVCANCFEDTDLTALIAEHNQQPGCDFCGEADAPTAPFEEIARHIHSRLREFYGRAAEELPYESAEGGYQGWTSDTWDLLAEEVGLDLPRDNSGALFEALVDEIGEEVWSEYDWVSLEPDDSLKSSWGAFCDIVKHGRRFFFHDVGATDTYHPDDRSPAQFLQALGKHINEQGLIAEVAEGYTLYRARPHKDGVQYTTALDLGPPPPEKAMQSNRMNAPGISMFYGADNPELATAETRELAVSIGRFETTRAIRILDLVSIPAVPGFFSSASRMRRFTLSFLHAFADLVIEPVDRNDRTKLDYIPTQVFTEFLRDFPFGGGQIDGVRYRSATGEDGVNVVLFATPQNLIDGEPDPDYAPPHERWLRLVSVEQQDAIEASKAS